MKLPSVHLFSLIACAAVAAAAGNTTNLFSVLGPTGAPLFRTKATVLGAPDNHVPIREWYFATGANARSRAPVTVVRTVDFASPVLLTAYVNGQNLREVSVLSLFESSSNGWLVNAGYNQVLTSARVSSIETRATGDGVQEKLTFSYDKMVSFFSDGNGSNVAHWN